MKMKCNVFHAYLALREKKTAAVYDANVGIINVVHARQLRLSIIVVLAQLGIFKGGWFCLVAFVVATEAITAPTDVSTHCIAVFVLDVFSTCFGVCVFFSFCSFVSSAVCVFVSLSFEPWIILNAYISNQKGKQKSSVRQKKAFI